MGLAQLNSEMATSFGIPATDSASAFYETQMLSLPVPERYNEQPTFAAPIASNNIGTVAPVNQSTSALDYLSTVGRRLADAVVTKVENTVSSSVKMGSPIGDNHEAPGASPSNKNSELLPGIPNIVLYAVGAFIIWKVTK